MSMEARFGGKCEKCDAYIPAGANVNYNPQTRRIRHAPTCKKGAEEAAAIKAEPKSEALTPDSEILGKAEYKGKEYLVTWHGTTKRGTVAAKLAFRDGSKTFWADANEFRIVKTYREPITLRKLNQLAEEFKADRAREEKAIADARKAQTDRDAAREAKAVSSGKTVAEILAEEQAAAAEARKGLVDFERDGKNSASVGERTTSTAKKTGVVTHYEIVSVGKSYYHSEDACDDMDCFCGSYGWKTPYTARKIDATPEQLAAEAKAAAEAEERKALETAIRASYSHLTNIPASPAGVTMTAIWSDTRMAGSESWYLGSDGIVYRIQSSYDDGPYYWSTTATPEQISRAKALGMKAI